MIEIVARKTKRKEPLKSKTSDRAESSSSSEPPEVLHSDDLTININGNSLDMDSLILLGKILRFFGISPFLFSIILSI